MQKRNILIARMTLWATIAWAGIPLVALHASSGVNFYVATNGNDQWTGKLPGPNAAASDGPFATIGRARDQIRRLKSTGQLNAPVMVQLRGGTYYLTETVTFMPEDSGTEENPITYAAYPDERPLLIGGRRIAGFKLGRGPIQVVDLAQAKGGGWFFRQLFVRDDAGADDECMIRARTPNLDQADPCRGGFLYVDRNADGFGHVVGCINNPGEWVEYEADIPAGSDYAVWIQYGADNKPNCGIADMSGRVVLVVDGGASISLTNLSDTGGWQKYRWSRSATLRLTAGKHTLRWKNLETGCLNTAGYALCDDPAWAPMLPELPRLRPGCHLVLISAQDFGRFRSEKMVLGDAAGGDLGVFRFKPGDIKPEWAVPGAELHIFQSQECRAFKEIVSIKNVDPQKNIVTVSGKECVAKLRAGDRYFVENVPDALDSPGEWYLDCQTGQLRLWPKKPITTDTVVVAPVVGRVFELKGDAQTGAKVNNLVFRGLHISDTDYSPDDGCAGYDCGSDGVVYLSNATACAVADCVFRNIGKCAVCIQGGSHNQIVGNEIAHGAEGGVVLRDTSNNSVSDNYIHDCGRVYKHIGGVVLEGGKCENNLIAHNLIHDISRYGISLKNPGMHNEIEYNILYNIGTETYDTGGIEVTQQDRQFISGSAIRYNIVHDVIGYSSDNGREVNLGWAIYLDSFAGGYDVHHNITWRNPNGGLMLQGGKNNRVWNNIFVGGKSTQAVFANFADNSRNNVFAHNIIYYSEPGALLFSVQNIHDGVMTADDNLYWHAGSGQPPGVAGVASFADWQKRSLDAHSIIADPLFVAQSHDDYRLRPTSPALGIGFQPIDTANIGIRKHR